VDYITCKSEQNVVTSVTDSRYATCQPHTVNRRSVWRKLRQNRQRQDAGSAAANYRPLSANTESRRQSAAHLVNMSTAQFTRLDWIEQCFTSPPTQYRLYGRRFFYRSKDPTNSIKVLKEQIVHRQIKQIISRHEHKTQQVP